jgi:ABC-2 type transport system ATP-binding protein
MSSHVLSEVEQVADRVAIIRAGRIVDVDDVDTWRHRAGQQVELRFGAVVDAEVFTGIATLENPQVTRWNSDGVSGTTLTCLLRGSPDALLKAAAPYPVLRWSAENRELEDLFLDFYRLPADEPTEVTADAR